MILKPNDIKNGMVVEIKNGKRFLVLNRQFVDKKLLGSKTFGLDSYGNNFKIKDENKVYEGVNYNNMEIVAVYNNYMAMFCEQYEEYLETVWTK